MRLHLFELEDQEWFPKSIREGITDFLQHAVVSADLYKPVANKLFDRLKTEKEVIDLCSGGGGPWSLLAEKANRYDLKITLSDLYPNVASFESISKKSNGMIEFAPSSVSAMEVPGEYQGFRTLFSSFHHFKPDQGAKIIQNAIEDKKGIAIFESTQRHILLILYMLLTPVLVMLSMPFIRPFKWMNIFWTYVIPAIPLAVMFDGIVSCLRTYTPSELKEMVNGLEGHEAYEWEYGVETIGKLPVGVTYLIGSPKQ